MSENGCTNVKFYRINSDCRVGLPATSPPLPTVLSPGGANRLTLKVGNRVQTTTEERYDVILPIARASTARFAGRGTAMFSLEFRRYARMFMVSSPARLPSRGSLRLRLLARRRLSKILGGVAPDGGSRCRPAIQMGGGLTGLDPSPTPI